MMKIDQIGVEEDVEENVEDVESEETTVEDIVEIERDVSPNLLKLYRVNVNYNLIVICSFIGRSSVGRASGWHSEGRRFDPVRRSINRKKK